MATTKNLIGAAANDPGLLELKKGFVDAERQADERQKDAAKIVDKLVEALPQKEKLQLSVVADDKKPGFFKIVSPHAEGKPLSYVTVKDTGLTIDHDVDRQEVAFGAPVYVTESNIKFEPFLGHLFRRRPWTERALKELGTSVNRRAHALKLHQKLGAAIFS
jgi:hypothetical protein